MDSLLILSRNTNNNTEEHTSKPTYHTLGRLIFFSLNILVLIYTILMVYLISRYSQLPPTNSHESPIDAICLIAMGDYAKTPLAPGAIQSLQEHSPPSIPIYLITDHPLCFTHLSNIHLVHVPGLPQHSSDLAKQLDAKSYKTRLFDLLPQHVQGLLYLDVDIRVTTSFSSWLDSLPHKLSQEPSFVLAMPGERHYADSAFNSGIMVMEREASKACLVAWRRLVLSGEYDMDQKALADTGEVCSPMLLFDHRETLLYMRDWWTGLLYELGLVSQAPMLHFTKSLQTMEESSAGCSGLLDCARLWMIERVYLREDFHERRTC